MTVSIDSLQALELVKGTPALFDLVITDMTMPYIMGDKLAQEILEIRPDLPIILCTGFSERINSERAKDIGISGFLYKPVVKAELAKMLRAILDGPID